MSGPHGTSIEHTTRGAGCGAGQQVCRRRRCGRAVCDKPLVTGMQAAMCTMALLGLAPPAGADGSPDSGTAGAAQKSSVDAGGFLSFLGPTGVTLVVGATLGAGRALQKLEAVEKAQTESKEAITKLESEMKKAQTESKKAQTETKELIERKTAMITGRVGILALVVASIVTVLVTLGVEDAFDKVLSRLGP